MAGAFVLAALNFLVVEYETDVPQFAVVWYLPALALVSSLALGLVRLISPGRWAAVQAAAVHLLFVGLVAVLLLVLGFDAPKLPLLVAPAIVLDLGARWKLAPPLQGAAFAIVLCVVYAAALKWAGSGVDLDANDLLLALPLAAVAAVAGPLASFGVRVPPNTARAAAVALLLLAFPVANAQAHDPGQGVAAGKMRLVASAEGRMVSVSATALDGPRCSRAQSAELIARRAGEEFRARLRQAGCRFTGRVVVNDDGRWFLYVDRAQGGRRIESWLQFKVGQGDGRVVEPRRYAYVPTESSGSAAKWVAGGLLYAAVLGLLAAVIALVRREGAQVAGVSG